jgi:hypothetical protein
LRHVSRHPGRPRRQRPLQILLALLLGGVVGWVTLTLVVVIAVREDQDVRDRVSQEASSTAALSDGMLIVHPDTGRLLTTADDHAAELIDPASPLVQVR